LKAVGHHRQDPDVALHQRGVSLALRHVVGEVRLVLERPGELLLLVRRRDRVVVACHFRRREPARLRDLQDLRSAVRRESAVRRLIAVSRGCASFAWSASARICCAAEP
jgi:hypothetical protein